jgi:hypothetical protein
MDVFGLVMTREECRRFREEIMRRHYELRKQIMKFNPLLDARGGFPTVGGGTTRPKGHFDQIIERQRGIKKDLKRYLEECKCKDDEDGPGNPPLPRSVDHLANVPIQEPRDIGPDDIPSSNTAFWILFGLGIGMAGSPVGLGTGLVLGLGLAGAGR